MTRDGRRMAAVVITPEGHELRIYDLHTGQRQTWLKAEYIGGPFWNSRGDKILVRVWTGRRAAMLLGSPSAEPRPIRCSPPTPGGLQSRPTTMTTRPSSPASERLRHRPAST